MAPHRNITFNVAPRYTPGSPAAVPYETALKVAREERFSYEAAKEGTIGDDLKLKADTVGLDMIVFEMDETAKGWNVHDMITDKQWFWPFEGRCPSCKRRERLKRGILQAHVTGNPAYNPCAADTFLGSELKDERRFRSYFEAMK